MLVLRRRAGECLLIGDDIEIEFLEVNSQAVKVGIRAPRHVSILRKELKIVEEANRAAAQSVDLEKIAGSLKISPPKAKTPDSSSDKAE